jgi:hypothetical protein
LHHCRNSADGRGRRKQMDMVGHQDVGVNRTSMTSSCIPETAEV